MSCAVLLLFAGLQPTDNNPDALGEAYLVMDVADMLLQSVGPTASAGQYHKVPDADAAAAGQRTSASSRHAACRSLALCIEVGLISHGD